MAEDVYAIVCAFVCMSFCQEEGASVDFGFRVNACKCVRDVMILFVVVEYLTVLLL